MDIGPATSSGGKSVSFLCRDPASAVFFRPDADFQDTALGIENCRAQREKPKHEGMTAISPVTTTKFGCLSK
jgi:hypothetical protein